MHSRSAYKEGRPQSISRGMTEGHISRDAAGHIKRHSSTACHDGWQQGTSRATAAGSTNRHGSREFQEAHHEGAQQDTSKSTAAGNTKSDGHIMKDGSTSRGMASGHIKRALSGQIKMDSSKAHQQEWQQGTSRRTAARNIQRKGGWSYQQGQQKGTSRGMAARHITRHRCPAAVGPSQRRLHPSHPMWGIGTARGGVRRCMMGPLAGKQVLPQPAGAKVDGFCSVRLLSPQVG